MWSFWQPSASAAAWRCRTLHLPPEGKKKTPVLDWVWLLWDVSLHCWILNHYFTTCIFVVDWLGLCGSIAVSIIYGHHQTKGQRWQQQLLFSFVYLCRETLLKKIKETMCLLFLLRDSECCCVWFQTYFYIWFTFVIASVLVLCPPVNHWHKSRCNMWLVSVDLGLLLTVVGDSHYQFNSNFI